MEEKWGDDDGLSHLLALEEPAACHLPCLVRFRSFSDATDTTTNNNNSSNSNNNNNDSNNNSNGAGREAAWHAASPTSFCVHRRRRLDDAAGCGGEAVVQPLLRVLRDPMAVARRRLETLRWFDTPRGADDIVARLALDRRIGVTPSLAAVHKALARLRQLRRPDVIADLAEDIATDAPVMSLWTLLKIVEGLEGEPQRAACVLFSLAPLITNGTVPTSVWMSLCCELDKLARQVPAPLEHALVDLFGKVFYRIRDDGPVSGSIVVYYGQALLKSCAPIRSVVEFVQTELLSGRNALPADAASELRLGAFLSDLIEAICANPDAADEREKELPLSVKEKLLCCSDFVKHAYAGRLRLAQSAFDLFLRFCDEEKDYHRLCVLFSAMCALSAPTLLSATRVAEVLCDIEELSQYYAGVLRHPVSLLMLYVIVRHGRSSLFLADSRENRRAETLEEHFCRCVARLCARDGDALIAMDVFFALVEYGTPAGAHAFICALSTAMCLPQLSRGGGSAIKMSVAAFEPLNLETLYYALRPRTVALEAFCAFIQARPSASSFFARDNGCITPERALSNLFTSPQVYGTVIDVTALCALAESAALAEAFVKMMNSYAGKTGAFALVHFDVCTAGQLTEEARQLLVTWLAQHSWLIFIPLSIAVQLATCSGAATRAVSPSPPTQPQAQPQRSCVCLFHAIRRLGHSRVMFVTASPHVLEEVRAEGVQPAITVAELKARLGLR